MKILPIVRAFNKASEIGFNAFAPSIFLAGCNLRCPYCMNARLVFDQVDKEIDLEEVKAFVLEQNDPWLVISGGEPTLPVHGSIQDLLEEIKSWGDIRIGMSTNGTNINTLKEIIHLLSYVALDIKSAQGMTYGEIDNPNLYMNMCESLKLLKATAKEREDFSYEVRTTLFPLYVNEHDLHAIGQMIAHDGVWVLQQFRHARTMIDAGVCRSVEPYNDDKIKEMVEVAEVYCQNVHLRHV